MTPNYFYIAVHVQWASVSFAFASYSQTKCFISWMMCSQINKHRVNNKSARPYQVIKFWIIGFQHPLVYSVKHRTWTLLYLDTSVIWYLVHLIYYYSSNCWSNNINNIIYTYLAIYFTVIVNKIMYFLKINLGVICLETLLLGLFHIS